MTRYCLALDLKDDETLIAEYEKMHREVWPEIINSIKNADIENLEIYRTGNRLLPAAKSGEKWMMMDKIFSL